VLYRDSKDGLLEIHLGDIDSIAKKPTNADDTFARSFAVPCALGKYGCTPDDCSAPVLVEYLTELLYISMMSRYCEKQRDLYGRDLYDGLLDNMKCKTLTEMKQRTALLARRPEYAQVYGYMQTLDAQKQHMQTLDAQKQHPDTTRCRHCLLVPETGDPTVVDCVRKKTLSGCTVIGSDRKNHVFYGHSANRLVGYRNGSVAFAQMSHAVDLSPIRYNPWITPNVGNTLDTSMSTS
jgi:hypothetical protein